MATQYSCLQNSIDGEAWELRPWSHKESDTTEWLHFREFNKFFTFYICFYLGSVSYFKKVFKRRVHFFKAPLESCNLGSVFTRRGSYNFAISENEKIRERRQIELPFLEY